ncbi:MAG: sialidase family protein [Kiritimatiellae bacterium]|nr:sialidase family protein [Kiritimatiellia bacterium]MDD5522929.1 sialidase family protein [Kiritimatiellia bacterium]
MRNVKNIVVLLFVLFGFNVFSVFGAEKVTLHPKAEPFPSKYVGPFVHLPGSGILALGGKEAHVSFDKGKNWKTYQAIFSDKHSIGTRSLVRTRDGVTVCIFCNNKEVKRGKGWGKGTPEEWNIPVYSIRSTDDGKTWSEPLAIQRDWVGELRAMVLLENGRIVIAAMAIDPGWYHVIPVYYSDDKGLSWHKTETVKMPGSKKNDHDGAMEPKLFEKKDHSICMTIRTTRGTFYESISRDGGKTWSEPVSTGIENNNSFGEFEKLSDGRLILIWNRDDKYPAFNYKPDPKDWPLEESSYSWIKRRNKLSLAISSDEGKTWTEPVVIASTDNEKFWIAYTVFFEVEPGIFWITTGQGNVRMQIREKDIYPDGEK